MGTCPLAKEGFFRSLASLSFLTSGYFIFLSEEENKLFIAGNTELFILPGYQIKTADGLITNFHLPKSTLLLLVSAFVGEKFWKQIYEEALVNNYRFLSYGDSSLLIR